MREVAIAREHGMDSPDRIRPEWYGEAAKRIEPLMDQFSANQRRIFSKGTTHMSV